MDDDRSEILNENAAERQ